MQQNSVIDTTAIDQIRALQPPDGEDLVSKIIGLFIDESARLQGCIAQAVGQSDCEAVAQFAHSLKSCSANVGAMTVTSLSQALESAGREGHLDHITELLPKLHTDLNAAINELRLLIESPAA